MALEDLMQSGPHRRGGLTAAYAGWVLLTQRLDELAIEALGPQSSHEGREAAVARGRYLYDRAVTILGGTSEIQRNIMARAMLGL